MVITIWEMLHQEAIAGGINDRIVIEKFSAASSSEKLYDVTFTSDEIRVDRDSVLPPICCTRYGRRLFIRGTGTQELKDRVLNALSDKKNCRTVISRISSEPPRRKIAQLFVDNRGLVHRDPDEGPAYWYSGGDFYKYYVWHGLFHRVGGPAVVQTRNRRLVASDWYRYGRLHRPLAEGAARNFNEEPRHSRTPERAYFLHGYQYYAPRNGGQRMHTDDNIQQKYDGRFPRGAGVRRQEPAVSWLRSKQRMRDAEMQGVHLPDPPTRPPELPLGGYRPLSWAFGPD